jgi:nitroreductase
MDTRDAFVRLLDGRTSTRAFLDTPVEDGVLQALLVQARMAPSGSNLQPGCFIQVRGEVRRHLSEELVRHGAATTRRTRTTTTPPSPCR